MPPMTTMYSPNGLSEIEVPNASVQEMKAQGWTLKARAAKKGKSAGNGAAALGADVGPAEGPDQGAEPAEDGPAEDQVEHGDAAL